MIDRCRKCNAKIGWSGELTKPPPCSNCGHINSYTGTNEELKEIEGVLLKIWKLELEGNFEEVQKLRQRYSIQ